MSISAAASNTATKKTSFLDLPNETMEEIFKYLLCSTINHKCVARDVPSTFEADEFCNQMASARLDMMEPFKKVVGIQGRNRAVNISSCSLQVSLLRLHPRCATVGRQILYQDNQYIAVRSADPHFLNNLRAYGIQVFKGCFAASSGKVVYGNVSHLSQGNSQIRPIMTLQIGGNRFKKGFIFCLEDLQELIHFLWLHVYNAGRWMPTGPALRINLRSNLNVKGFCTNDDAIDKLVKYPILPWLGRFVLSASCGTVGKTGDFDSVQQERLDRLKDIPAIPTEEAFCNRILGHVSRLLKSAEIMMTSKKVEAERLYELALRNICAFIREMWARGPHPISTLLKLDQFYSHLILTSQQLLHLRSDIEEGHTLLDERRAAILCIEYGCLALRFNFRMDPTALHRRMELTFCEQCVRLGHSMSAKHLASSFLIAMSPPGSVARQTLHAGVWQLMRRASERAGAIYATKSQHRSSSADQIEKDAEKARKAVWREWIREQRAIVDKKWPKVEDLA